MTPTKRTPETSFLLKRISPRCEELKGPLRAGPPTRVRNCRKTHRRRTLSVSSPKTISRIDGSVAIVGFANGLGPVVEPWLPIPARQYYLWMGLFTPLIYLVNFLILAGIVQLLSRLVRGQGSFEDTFVVVSLAFSFPAFMTMWVFETPVLVFFPECRRAELGGLAYLPEWLDTGRQILGALWIVVILVAAISRVQRVSLLRSSLIVVPAFALAWAVMLTYLR